MSAPAAKGRPVASKHGSHLVMSAVIQIVVVIVVALLTIGARNATSAVGASKRAEAASSVALDLEKVSAANVELEAAFERAAGLQDLGARTWRRSR